MMKKTPKIFLTGHNGMVGSGLFEQLIGSGYTNVITRRSTQLDLRNQTVVFDFIDSIKPDIVIHTAARVGGIQANINNPVSFLSDNVSMNFNLIDACVKNEVKNFVFLGSSCMYPKDYQNPLKEEYILKAPLEPTNEGYALSKITGAKYCEYVNDQYSWNYKTIIPCNLYGEKDHFEPNRSHLVAAVINKLFEAKQKSEKEVEIWGDGTARREFLYVKDLVKFISSNIDRLDKLPNYINVGYGKDFSVNEYYEMIADLIGYEGSFTHDLTKPTGMKFKLMDSSKAFNLGWEPSFKIKEGLSKTINYYKNEVRK